MKGPYSDLDLTEVIKPIRYLGGEPGELINTKALTSAVLAFPDVYEIGMSHLGTRVLYQVVNADPRLRLERAFAPWPDMEKLLRSTNTPLRSLETGTPLRKFPVVGFSLQFELTYTGVLQMLDLGGIPLLRAERQEGDPIVVAGGPNVTHPEPMVDFIDIFAIGDGEVTLPWMMLTDYRLRQEGVPRDERIRLLAHSPHLYAPATRRTFVHKPSGRVIVGKSLDSEEPADIVPAVVDDIDSVPSTVGGPRPYMAVFARASIEIARGCTQGCRFCQAGFIYRPLRERHPRQIMKDVDEAIATGEEEVSLTALSTLDYTNFEDLLEMVAAKVRAVKGSVGISSMRAYGLSERFLNLLRTGRGGGLTFAPEAGTQRLRDAINKNVREEDLLESVAKVAALGWSRVKLYFILGLPTETEEDLRAIPALGHRAWLAGKQAVKGKKRMRPPQITCSMSSLVPKPHTPFQWMPALSLDDITARQQVVREAASGQRVRLRFHDPRVSVLEAVFARGDRRLGRVILEAYRLGARFDGWEDLFDYSIWEEAFHRTGTDMREYLAPLDTQAPTPWDHIKVGVDRDFLLAEYQKTLGGITTPSCFQLQPPRIIPCHVCGAECDLKDRRRQVFDFIDFFDKNMSKAKSPEESQDRTASENISKDIRLRVIFAKRGDGRYFGHGDLLGLIPRILRAAGLNLKYSQGFNPKPKMVFAPPLPFGVESEGEIVEVRVTEEPWRAFPDPEGRAELISRLNRHAPRGIVFTDVQISDTHIQEDIVAALHETTEPVSSSEIDRLLGTLEEGIVIREREGKKPVEFSLKDEVVSVKLTADGRMDFILRVHQGPTLSPREFLEFAGLDTSYRRIAFVFRSQIFQN